MSTPVDRPTESGRTFDTERMSYVLRVTSMILLAIFYAVVGGRWAIVAIREFRGVSSDDWADRLLTGANAVVGALFFLALAALMFFRKEPIRREKRIVGWLLPTIAVLAFGLSAQGDPRGWPTWVLVIATIFVSVGGVLTFYGLRHLGRHFGVVPDVRGLVTTGPYRFVRHPLYAGETLTSAGLVIVVATPWAVALFALGLVMQVWRAKLEERALTSVFSEYRDYAARTPMLVPFLRLPGSGRANVETE